jgi:hypothetical protein
MRETLKYAMAVGITAAMFAYMYEESPNKFIKNGAKPLAAAPSVWRHEPLQQTSGDSRPAFDLDTSNLSEEELHSLQSDWMEAQIRKAHCAIYVTPYNVYRPTCDILLTEPLEDGSRPQAEDCEVGWKYPRHEYYSLSNTALNSLAYGDALAAQILAERIGKTHPDEALGLAIHATALSGKAGPLLAVSSGPFDIKFDEIDTAPIEDIYRFLALDEVATRLIDGFGFNEIPKIFVEKRQVKPEILDHYVKDLSRELIRRQAELGTGTSFKEVLGV